MSENDPILVGVDGGVGGRAAIAYAAAEAGLDDADLWLVHVTPSEPTYPYSWIGGDLRAAADALLKKATEEAVAYVGAERVTATLLQGSAVPGLVHCAAAARLVVLGDDRRQGLERIMTGSVTNRVAGHAPAPVVVVPSGWSPDDPSRRVVVAVKDCASSVGLLARALKHAADRAAELVVLHAWQLDTVYDDMTVAHLDMSDWENATRLTLDDALGRARRRVPHASDVAVRIEVRHGQPARKITEETRNADLLVIDRRRHSFPLGRLGNTGRAVIRESRCPVEIHPPSPDVLMVDDLVLEREGRLERAGPARAG
ncbi:universal stress protein [Nocardioides sp. NPDC059952]|uniref:universal stress protein n=1 Tax=Nocardioides sp. NPDC059952 TaxID=3347014 RepID=UPI003656ECAC